MRFSKAHTPGWRRSLPDYRDKPYRFSAALKPELAGEFPPAQRPQKLQVDAQPVLNQGYSSACTGYGTAPMVSVERNVTTRSATFIYAEARKLIGELDVDNGAYGRDAVSVACNLGVPRDDLWPHELDRNTHIPPNLFLDPSTKADIDAAKRKSFTYHGLATRQEFRSCLQRHTFCIGIAIYANFYDLIVDRFGIVPLPAGTDYGGHWIWVIGSDFNFRESEWAAWARAGGFPANQIPNEVYIFQNSWDIVWGRQGRGVLPAAFLEDRDLSADGQTLRGFADGRL